MTARKKTYSKFVWIYCMIYVGRMEQIIRKYLGSPRRIFQETPKAQKCHGKPFSCTEQSRSIQLYRQHDSFVYMHFGLVF